MLAEAESTAEEPARPARGRSPGKKTTQKRVGVEPGKIVAPGSPNTLRGPGVAFVPVPGQKMPGDKRKLAFDWSLISTEYIDGKIVDDKVHGGFKKVYPTYSELENRWGVKRSTIAYRCQVEKWGERRLQINQQIISEVEAELSKRRALEISDVIGTLDSFLGQFAREVKHHKQKPASIAEYDRALRLRVYALNEMRERAAGAGVVTLEQLQDRHTKQRERARDLAPETAGYTPGRDEREAAGALEQQAQAMADQKVADAVAKADAQALRAETHLAGLGRARQAMRDQAADRRALRYRERSKRLAALDAWARALFLSAPPRKASGA